MGGRKNLAATMVVFVITFAIAIPVLLFASALVAQGVDSVNRINDWIRAGNLQHLIEDPKVLSSYHWVEDRFGFLELQKLDIPGNLMQISKDLGQFIISKGASFLGNAATLLTDFFIMMFIVFYLVRDGANMVERMRYYSPLQKKQEDKILQSARMVSRSVLMGSFLTALCQGIVGGIGLMIVGIPGLFWGTVMGFASLIPVVGTALIWGPAAIYLALLGKWTSFFFLIGWSILLVGSIDNFLRPFLMRGEAKMSPFYIFLAILGGVQYFGLAGVLYGPLILSFVTIMFYIYGVEYHDELLAQKVEMEAPEAQE
jgi:predicted PurR-regulated permease PerM